MLLQDALREQNAQRNATYMFNKRVTDAPKGGLHRQQ